MSIWKRISDALAVLAQGEGLSAVFEKLRTPPERTIGFTIAVIALGAKMAKADGLVTRDEVTAFRQVFHIPASETQNAARVFDLARKDVAGFDLYAARIRDMFGAGHQALVDLLEGLFYIAVADGRYHPNENVFLEEVARIFGVQSRDFVNMRSRFVPDENPDPYCILGIEPTADAETVRQAWRALVREYHPDRMIARGVPEEAMKLAEKRLIQANWAYEEILNTHR
ncbi:MAG: molecular chaperone DjiA [Rhodobacteraceae bacterium]|jgi:DnaJ like chaperone protein|nr:molecular chaperone DjiA [Paracoccaceae bacterium]NDD89542.1 molecular chaperone DjiA [Paracoccaceae bacterium]NDI04244.1 molecular chaperone DjiA [Paracoccaceae bacterium]HAY90666.1 molecular chaperone DjlA [Paracoccaceae bacterium]